MSKPNETSAPRYNVVTPDTGLQLPTIVDNETNQSILAIDTRTVDGISYSTPVFDNTSMAIAVADFLNHAHVLAETDLDTVHRTDLGKTLLDRVEESDGLLARLSASGGRNIDLLKRAEAAEAKVARSETLSRNLIPETERTPNTYQDTGAAYDEGHTDGWNEALAALARILSGGE